MIDAYTFLVNAVCAKCCYNTGDCVCVIDLRDTSKAISHEACTKEEVLKLMEFEEQCLDRGRGQRCGNCEKCELYPAIKSLNETMKIKLDYALDRGLIDQRSYHLRQAAAKVDITDMKHP